MKEVIFIGLPGPTHHYGGLSGDNVAAVSNKGSLSNPKQAALQALGLIRLLLALGVEVAILPPQLRPHLGLLRQHFKGNDEEIIAQAARHSHGLLEKASSSSAMWTANAATITPAADSDDHKLHITVANLFTNLHRRIEAEATHRVLQAIFKNVPDCEVHAPLPFTLCDEGAANHMRLSPDHAAAGLNVFVYGENGRQDLEASRDIAAKHHIPDARALFVKQNPDVIRAGVFHNDVIAVSNENVLLAHEDAYAGGRADIGRISQAYNALRPVRSLASIVVRREELSVEEAVHSYFFNSQIVTMPNGKMALIAPLEVKKLYRGRGARLMKRIRADRNNPIKEVHYIDLRQSMRNGGGPACLRLRVPMTEAQLQAVRQNANIFADKKLLAAMAKVIKRHYPDKLSSAELGDPKLYHQCRAMLEEMGQVMGLPLLAG